MMRKVKEKLAKMFQGRYGLDELGGTLMMFSLAVYLLGVALKNAMVFFLSIAGIITVFYRVMSRQYWDRSEENRKYMRYVKLWQLKFENRKHSRIFMCKRCGKYIRVPKGKIQVIYTACGDKTIHYT